jgi:NAD(P)-dependent dehydrogenase (short-subunit alcohol dehydrogenase family)
MKDKRVLIAGATTEIGRALLLNQICQEVGSLGCNTLLLPYDVSDEVDLCDYNDGKTT